MLASATWPWKVRKLRVDPVFAEDRRVPGAVKRVEPEQLGDCSKLIIGRGLFLAVGAWNASLAVLRYAAWLEILARRIRREP